MLAELFFVERYRGYGERAWIAWHCLPRGKFGRPPAMERLALKVGLHKTELRRFIYGLYPNPSYKVAKASADALCVSLEWLMHEQGKPPELEIGLDLPKWPGPEGAGRAHPKDEADLLTVVHPGFEGRAPKSKAVRHQKKPRKFTGASPKATRPKRAPE